MRWLADITMPHPAQQITLQEYIHAIMEGSGRVTRLTDQIQKLLPEWHMEPVVKALQALRGVAPVVATTSIAEIGDMNRFERPGQFMTYLGLFPQSTPAEKASSGAASPKPAMGTSGALLLKRPRHTVFLPV
jgi:transposase